MLVNDVGRASGVLFSPNPKSMRQLIFLSGPTAHDGDQRGASQVRGCEVALVILFSRFPDVWTISHRRNGQCSVAPRWQDWHIVHVCQGTHKGPCYCRDERVLDTYGSFSGVLNILVVSERTTQTVGRTPLDARFLAFPGTHTRCLCDRLDRKRFLTTRI